MVYLGSSLLDKLDKLYRDVEGWDGLPLVTWESLVEPVTNNSRMDFGTKVHEWIQWNKLRPAGVDQPICPYSNEAEAIDLLKGLALPKMITAEFPVAGYPFGMQGLYYESHIDLVDTDMGLWDIKTSQSRFDVLDYIANIQGGMYCELSGVSKLRFILLQHNSHYELVDATIALYEHTDERREYLKELLEWCKTALPTNNIATGRHTDNTGRRHAIAYRPDERVAGHPV